MAAIESNELHPDRRVTIKALTDIIATGPLLSTQISAVHYGIAVGLERGCYNRAIELEEKNSAIASWVVPSFIGTYRMVRHMLCDKAKTLVATKETERILFDANQWQRISATPIYDLVPNVFAEITAGLNARKNIEVQRAYLKDPCGNCNKYKVYELSVQERGMDESSTLYLICDACNSRTSVNK